MSFVLDAYAARSCPLKTVNAFTPNLVAPSLTRGTPSFFHDPAEVEAEIVGAIRTGGSTVADLRKLADQPSPIQVEACLSAMRDGYDVILGCLLPRDWDAHRSGRPSMLVRDPEGGYHPVQIKYHRVLEGRPPGPGLKASALPDPMQRVSVPGRGFKWGRLNAALQVAHYRRLLEATGMAASHPWAGIVGLDRIPLPDRPEPAPVITWIDLERRCVTPNPRDATDAPELLTTLERYDAEHAYRVRLAQSASEASGGETLLTPVVSSECQYCVWQTYCQTKLDADDLSLRITKAPLDVHEVRILRSLGVTTVADLAAADIDSLLESFLPETSQRPGGEDRLRMAQRRARMLDAGTELERRTEGPIDLPRHDLEIDIDVETSAADRVYLWGFWVDDALAGTRQYVHFSSFSDADAAGEAVLATEAFTWLRELVDGRDAAVYHYSDYEVVRINRLVSRCDESGEWMAQLAASSFVDLFRLVKKHFFGANGLGLKVVATATTGFEWRDPEPGGLNSQTWFDEAVNGESEEIREQAKTRVLEYNEDDVRATWHLRNWLRGLD